MLLGPCLLLLEAEEDNLKFRDLYDRYVVQMVKYAESILHNHYDAEDAVQDAFVCLARTFDKISCFNERTMRAYVMTTVKNKALNRLKQREKAGLLVDSEKAGTFCDPRTLDEIMKFIDEESIIAAVSKLKPTYRDVLLLHCMDNMKTKDIARALGRKVSTVKKQLVRGKQMLALILKEEDVQ